MMSKEESEGKLLEGGGGGGGEGVDELGKSGSSG